MDGLSEMGTELSFADYVHLFEHLFSVCQMLYGQTYSVADRFRKEVASITQGHAQLLFRHQKLIKKNHGASPANSVNFPVQFSDRVYGTLYIASDLANPESPSVPLAVAHLLAQACGLLLYTLEMSVFIQKQIQRLNLPASGPLTKRERDVLALMARGYDQEAIAKALSITPSTVSKHRQHIYEQLGVHNEHDALLAAFQAGLFSLLDEISR